MKYCWVIKFIFSTHSTVRHISLTPFYIDLKAESGAKDLLKLIEILFPSYGMTGAEAHFNNLAGQYWTGLAKLLHFFINYEPSA